jgi:hypothetical protein
MFQTFSFAAANYSLTNERSKPGSNNRILALAILTVVKDHNPVEGFAQLMSASGI